MPKEIWAMDYLEGLEPDVTVKRVWFPDGGGDTTKYIRADCVTNDTLLFKQMREIQDDLINLYKNLTPGTCKYIRAGLASENPPETEGNEPCVSDDFPIVKIEFPEKGITLEGAINQKDATKILNIAMNAKCDKNKTLLSDKDATIRDLARALLQTKLEIIEQNGTEYYKDEFKHIESALQKHAKIIEEIENE